MNVSRTNRRPAFTLLELLAVIWVLALIMGFGGVLLLAAIRTDQLAGNTIHSIVRNGELADLFRAGGGKVDFRALPAYDGEGHWMPEAEGGVKLAAAELDRALRSVRTPTAGKR